MSTTLVPLDDLAFRIIAEEPAVGGDEERRGALWWVKDRGFPSVKDEDWRYTPLEALLTAPMRPAQRLAGPLPTEETARAPDLGGPRLVFVDGFYTPELSRLAPRPDGVTVTAMAEVPSAPVELDRRTLGSTAEGYRHAFHALNAALAMGGARVSLAPGAAPDDPIHVVYVQRASGAPVLASPHVVIDAGPGSRAVVVESYLGAAGSSGCTNARTELLLSEGATLWHSKVQDQPLSTSHIASLEARLDAHSQLTSTSLACGAAVARHEVSVLLAGEGARLELAGLYLPGEGQVHDNPVFIDHAAPSGLSRQLYKGVADGDGRGIFNGRILVRPEAQRTDASQVNTNLVVSERAEIDTRPRLEILADDVLCSHGAAVGALDEEALFYLRSRGISAASARALLIEGFTSEIVTRFAPEALTAAVRELVAARLGHGSGEASGASPWA